MAQFLQSNLRSWPFFPLDQKIKSQEAVVFTDLDDGSAILLHLDNKFYYSLNETGSLMWQLIEKSGGSMTMAAMVEALCEHFDVTPEQARADAKEFIEDLAKEGLVTVKQG
jgi:hypothetical protein